MLLTLFKYRDRPILGLGSIAQVCSRFRDISDSLWIEYLIIQEGTGSLSARPCQHKQMNLCIKVSIWQVYAIIVPPIYRVAMTSLFLSLMQEVGQDPIYAEVRKKYRTLHL